MLGTRPPEIAPLRALALLDRLDADLLRAKDSSLDAARLHALLTDVVDTTHAISASIADELFGVAPAASSASREATPVASQSQSQSPSQGASQRQSQHGSQG
jgi:hypothetical protein